MRVNSIDRDTSIVGNDAAQIANNLKAIARKYDTSVRDLVADARAAGDDATAEQVRIVRMADRYNKLMSL